MVLDGTLKYWNNGEPTIPDEGLTGLKYWLNGEPYTIEKAAVGWTGTILGVTNPAKINGIAVANIAKVMGI